MITRRRVVLAFGAGTFAPLASFAQQQAGKLFRLGYLASRPGIDVEEEALRQGLRELGYVEGKNLVIEWRFTKGNTALLPEVAAELVRLRMDCIVS